MGLQRALVLERVARLPRARPLEYVTPSSATALGECMLRAAYRSDPESGRHVPSSPSARLGSACHRVLVRAANGALGLAGAASWRARFEDEWDEAVGVQARLAAAAPLERHWPAPAHWPGYAMRKARTRRLGERVSPSGSATDAPGDGELRLEEAQVALAGRLRGRPDAVRRGAETIVEDYKTGALLNEAGELRPAYRTQLLLYAVLEHETTGRWPAYARLVPLEGDAVEFEVDEGEAEAAAEAALAALDAYNQAVNRGANIALADASPANCRFCPFAIGCPAFWQTAGEEWEGLWAVAGQLDRSDASALETIDLVIEVAAGTTAESPVRLHGLPADRFGHLLDPAPGSVVAAVGLRPGRVENELQATERTRVTRVGV